MIITRTAELPDLCFGDLYCGNSPGIPDLTGRTARLRLLGLAAKVNEPMPDPWVLTGLSVLVPLLRSSVAHSFGGQCDFTEAFALATDERPRIEGEF